MKITLWARNNPPRNRRNAIHPSSPPTRRESRRALRVQVQRRAPADLPLSTGGPSPPRGCSHDCRQRTTSVPVGYPACGVREPLDDDQESCRPEDRPASANDENVMPKPSRYKTNSPSYPHNPRGWGRWRSLQEQPRCFRTPSDGAAYRIGQRECQEGEYQPRRPSPERPSARPLRGAREPPPHSTPRRLPAAQPEKAIRATNERSSETGPRASVSATTVKTSGPNPREP